MINKLTRTITFALAACALFASAAWAQTSASKVEWNRFRGPNGSGIHSTSNAPLEWSDDKNIKWKCPLPGLGRSSPVVSGNRVFLTAHSLATKGEAGFERYLLCVDLDSGELLWQNRIKRTHAKPDESYSQGAFHSGYAAHTPTTDGEYVYAFFGSDGLFAFDMNGEQIWHLASAAEEDGFFGSASSPILYEDLLIVNEGAEARRIIAVDKARGKLVWEYRDQNLEANFTTPTIFSSGSRNELLIAMIESKGGKSDSKIVAVDVKTGKQNWTYKPPRNFQTFQISIPVTTDAGIFFQGDQSGGGHFTMPFPDLKEKPSKPLWTAHGSGSAVSSPLYFDGKIAVVSKAGILSIYKSKTGELIKKERLGTRQFMASPVRVRDHWLMISTDGRCDVRPTASSVDDEQQQPMNINQLKEDTPFFAATPTVTKNEILIRSDRFLYSVSSSDKDSSESLAKSESKKDGSDNSALIEAIELESRIEGLNRERRFKEGIKAAKQAVLLREKVLGKEHLSIATTLSKLAKLHESSKDYKGAAALHKRAINIREKALGPKAVKLSSSLFKLSRAQYLQGQYVAAKSNCERAIEIWEETLEPDNPGVATAINLLASLNSELGLLSVAERLQKKALKMREKVLGPNHRDVTSSLNNLATIHIDQGKFISAESLLKRALKMHESASRSNHPDAAFPISTLGKLFRLQGRLSEAENLFRRALKIRTDAFGDDDESVVETLNQLASLKIHQGKSEEAKPILARALTITEGDPEKLFESVGSINLLALLYSQQGKYSKAEDLLRQVLEILAKTHGPEHRDVASVLNNIAVTLKEQGKYGEAERLEQRSLKVSENALGTMHVDNAVTLSNLAVTSEKLGRIKNSALLFDKASRVYSNHAVCVLSALPEKDQQAFLNETYQYHLAKTLAFASENFEEPDVSSLSAAWLLNGKGLAQRALSRQNLQTRSLNSSDEEISQELIQIRQNLAQLAMRGSPISGAASHNKLISSLSRKEQELARRLNLRVDEAPDSKRTWIEHSELQKAIPNDSVLVDIARIDFDFENQTARENLAPSKYVAWLTFAKGKNVEIIELGLADEIDRMAKQVREGVAKASRTDFSTTVDEKAALESLEIKTEALANKIWKPLQASVAGSENVIISPDGALWLLPWAALPIDQGTFLVEKHGLKFVTSGRELLKTKVERKPNPPCLFANPSFDQSAEEKKISIQRVLKQNVHVESSTQNQTGSDRLLPVVLPLPNTAIEATAILPAIRSYSGKKPVLYQEDAALEQVAKTLQSPEIVTFATHGFFLPTQIVEPRQEPFRNIENRRSVLLDQNNKPLKNPLLRCGLLLAGCNERSSVVGNDDGILTGMEITGIDFRGTELVVLSACDTGVGDIQNGEGVAGLRQAFQLAGAESVLASLWQVDDVETARLMKLFFQNLADGKSKSEALRQAQLSRIKARRARHGAAHPFFWAAFTLTGQD